MPQNKPIAAAVEESNATKYNNLRSTNHFDYDTAFAFLTAGTPEFYYPLAPVLEELRNDKPLKQPSLRAHSILRRFSRYFNDLIDRLYR